MMDMSTSSLLIGVVTSAIGTGYFIYGKKQSRYVAIIAGVGLIVVPFFIQNTLGMVAACAALIAAPWLIRE
jgi:hypothetical protein